VEGFNDMEKLSAVEHGLLSVKQTDNSDRIKQLHSVDEFSQKVNVVVVFVGTDEFHDEGR
jgi:hypothetical protein